MSKNLLKFKYSHQSGMTLIELIVVLAIFMVVSSISIFDYGSFRTSSSIQNLVDDIALSVRKAQTFAIGTRGTTAGFTNTAYGIHFTTSSTVTNPLVGSKKAFIIFNDLGTPGNKQYDFPSNGACGNPINGNECYEILNITSNDKIKTIYIDGTPKIDPNASVDIVFKRPNPEASFCYKTSSTDSSCAITAISHVEIEVSSEQASGTTKKVSIWNTGQISIK